MFDKFIVGKAINTSGDTFAWNLSRSILHLVFEEYLLIILHVAFFHWQTTSQMNFHVLSELYCWHLLSIALMTAKSQLFTSALTNLTRYMGKLRCLGPYIKSGIISSERQPGQCCSILRCHMWRCFFQCCRKFETTFLPHSEF